MKRNDNLRSFGRSALVALAFQAGGAYGQAPSQVSGAARAPMTVAPPAERCQLMISESDIDYGSITRYRLESGGNAAELSLGKRRMMLNVTCSSASLLGMVFRGPSSGADYVFGKSGKVTMQLSEAQVDGRPVQVGNAGAAGTMPVSPAATARFMPGQVIVPVIDGKPAQGTRFSAAVEVEPVVPRGSSQVTSPTTLELNGAFQVLWR